MGAPSRWGIAGLRGDPCLAATIAIVAGGIAHDVRAAIAVMCAASDIFRVVRHMPKRRRTATQDALRASARCARTRTGVLSDRTDNAAMRTTYH